MNLEDLVIHVMIAISIVVFGFIIGSFGWLIISTVIATPTSQDIPIYTISDGSLTEGRFALGSGSLHEYPTYFAFEKTPNGGYHILSFNAEISEVYMDNNSSPYVTRYYKRANFLGTEYISSDYKYEFHVPSGTIYLNNFEIKGDF